MRFTLHLLASFLMPLIVTAAEPPIYKESDLQQISENLIEVAQHINIKKFRFKDGTWEEILDYIEKASKAGDAKGIGVEIFVPEEFRERFALIANATWTISLADGLDIMTIFVECHPHDWMYFPVEPRRIAVIPRDVLIRDLTTRKE